MVSAFVVTSALCGAAWSAESLIAFRVLQGLAGGMIMPIGMITLAQAAGPQRIGRVMGVVGVPMLLGPVLGPILGGLLVTHLSWRWIFFVNLPIGLVGLVLAAKLLPAGARRGTRGGARAAGLARPAPALPRRRARGLRPQRGLHPRLGDLRAPAAGARRRRCSSSPSRCAPGARRRRWSTCGCSRIAASRRPRVTVFLVGAALFGSLLLLPLYFQIARGLSPLQAGAAHGAPGPGRRAGHEPRRAADRPRRRRAGRHRRAVRADARHRRLHAGRPEHALLGARGLALRRAASAWASR